MVHKKTHIHFIAKTFYPAKGGLAKSAARIIQSLSSIEDFVTHVYVTGVKDFPPNTDNILSTYNLKEFLLQPYKELYQPTIGEKNKVDFFVRKNNMEAELNRVDFLVLKNNIEKIIKKYPQDNHVLLSFFVSTIGFICQIVADTLELPHITSARGADFYRDLYYPGGMSAIEWVTKRANYIVTTNNEQLRIINKLFSRSQKVTTIFNAIEPNFLNAQWSHQKREKIKLVSDIGFSFNKATHLLLKSVEQLLNKGHPLQLDLIGDIEASQAQNVTYWKTISQEYQTKYPGKFIFHQHLGSPDLLQIMLDSDIYVSSTLDEGCSNARLQALSIGIPIVSTKTAELKDITSMLGENNYIALSQPADPDGFTNCLEEMVLKVRQETCQPNVGYIEAIRKLCNLTNERDAWEKVIRDVI